MFVKGVIRRVIGKNIVPKKESKTAKEMKIEINVSVAVEEAVVVIHVAEGTVVETEAEEAALVVGNVAAKRLSIRIIVSDAVKPIICAEIAMQSLILMAIL